MFKKTIIVILLLIFTAAESQAISLGFTSSSLAVTEGETFNIKLAVSGLGDNASLGSFDLDIRFDPTFLSFKDAIYGDPLLGDQLSSEDIETIRLTTAGLDFVKLSELSYEDPVILDLMQADSFVLATLSFQALSRGTSSLWIFDKVLSDAWGEKLEADLVASSVGVHSPPVPEPASCILMTTGLALFAVIRQRRKRMQS